MKILINALSARLGGGQTYLINLLANLPDDSNLEILIYAPKSLKLVPDSRIRACSTAWPTKNPLLRTIWEKLALPIILYKNDINIMFCPGGIITSFVPRGCKKVTMFRNMIPFDARALSRIPIGFQKLRNIVLKRVMLKSMSNADLTIFISNYAKSVIENLVKIPNPVMIPHGLNENFRTHSKILSRPNLIPVGDYLLYVSRFDLYKHQLEVVTAFTILPREIQKQYKLLLIGEIDEQLVNQVLQLAAKNGIEKQIVVVGPLSYTDLPSLYHHATATLFASSCENCPNILLEALGAGRPILSSNVMPMPEFGLNSVEYFDPTDPKSIAAALDSVLNNKSRMLELASAAALRSNDYNWKITSKKTWDVISNLARN